MSDFDVQPRTDRLLPLAAYYAEQMRCDQASAGGGWPLFQPQLVVFREIGMNETSKSNYSAHDDRIGEWYGSDKYSQVCKKYWGSGELGLEHWLLEGASDERVLEFAKDVIELGGRAVKTVQGFRAVRNTNVSNGYPYFRFDAIVDYADQ